MKLINRFVESFSKVQPLPAGTHHLQAAQDEKPYRMHLRLQSDGSGILILNASTVMQLNPTAAEYAFHFIEGTDPEEAAKQIASRYRINRAAALKDFNDFADRIQTLVSTPDLDPVSYLDFELAQPHSAETNIPLRLDCALTYRLPADTQAEYAPARRVDRELTTDEWKTILDKAWTAGIPHITFTGGEATLRDDLPDLVAHAEKNGQICGLLTDGLRLSERKYFEPLLQAGLDHLLFLLQPDNPASWQALEIIMPQDIFVTAHLMLNNESLGHAEAALERLAKLNVHNLSLAITDASLRDSYKRLQNKAAELGFTLRFDLPVPYSESNPVAIETEQDQVPAGAGKAWVYVEPDGDLLPAQGMADTMLGNMLRDELKDILPRV